MRKIEQEMLTALEIAKYKSSYYWKKANTMVHRGLFGEDIDITFVYLHGNAIAKLYRNFANKLIKVEISNAGWDSPTTKSRLNVILNEYTANGGIWQKAFRWYYIDQQGDKREFPLNQFRTFFT